jgi:hypothetical protein
MLYLYGTGVAYGVGTGIWIDALTKTSDPGIAFIPPVAFGAAVPIGIYLWDDYSTFDKGVPSSIATGLLLGGLEGIAIDGMQWQFTNNHCTPIPNSNGDTYCNDWSFRTQTTVVFLGATIGGAGGWAFGEWFNPDPRALGFIASGAAWGTLTGIGLGIGFGDSGSNAGDGAAIGGFIGYNAGILATGALSTVYTPSWQTQKYMWLGYLFGALATTPVYLFYIGNADNIRHGLIANAAGGLAGVGIAAALTSGMSDDDQKHAKAWQPPFQIGLAPTQHGGAQLTAYGMW